MKHEIGATKYPYPKNQAFNYTNGDVYKWKCLCRLLPYKFDLEPLPYEGEGFSLVEVMKDKSSVWDAIVNENKLLDWALGKEVAHASVLNRLFDCITFNINIFSLKLGYSYIM